MAKLTVESIEKIKTAINNARTIEEVNRLEQALHDQDLSKVMDLISGGSHALSDSWQTDTQTKRKIAEPLKEEPVPKQPKTETVSTAPKSTTPKGTGSSSVALSLLIDRAKQDPSYQSSIASPSNSETWRSTQECSGFGGHSVLVIECGTALCMHNKLFSNDTLIRVLVVDFETEKTLLDEAVAIPPGSEIADSRSEYTGIPEGSESLTSGVTLTQVQDKVLALIKGPETLLITHSANRTAHALKLKHPRWLPLSLLFKISEKNRKSENFHVRAHLSPAQLRQAMLSEPSINWASETISTVATGDLRLVKLACAKFPRPQLEVDVPRAPESLWLQKIPRALNDTLPDLFGGVGTVGKILWKFETSENDWLGETQVSFETSETRDVLFDKLPTLIDVYVSWETTDQVSEDSLRALAGRFGKVCGVRMAAKTAEGGRPFGFVSFLSIEDAEKFAQAKRIKGPTFTIYARPSQSLGSKNPFKRVPVVGDKILEVFKM